MMENLTVTYRAVEDLNPYPRNARTHPKRQVRQIVDSINEFGFVNPILIDEEHEVIAGHGRLIAAKEMSLNDVPTICISGLTDAQKRALRLADNKIALNASWDLEVLTIEIEGLLEFETVFDIEITGFETAEIDLLLADQGQINSDPADDLINDDFSGPAVSKRGDIWELGPHRLICGDALSAATYKALLGKDQADLIMTDVPYNLKIAGNVRGKGAVAHGEFVMASGELSKKEYARFLTTAFRRMAEFSVDGSVHFVFIDWRHLEEIMTAGRKAYTRLLNLCVWNKTNGSMGSLYRSKHELIFVFKNGTARHSNNVELGRYGRNRANVWDYAGVNAFREGREEELALHPTVKPVPLIADAICDCSKRKGIVLDPFVGSGTTLIAADRTGRIGRAIELDPKYVDTAVRRFQRATGIEAVHAKSGKTFAEEAKARARKQVRGKGKKK